MSAAAWRYALASVIGTAHVRAALPCQDASACTVLTTTAGESVLVAVAADGAGSATQSEVGAQLACTLLINDLATLFAGGGAVGAVTRDFVHAWLTNFQSEIALRAASTGLRSRDFACTILGAVVGEDGAAFWQVGDGAIIITAPDGSDDYCWVFWPQHGEFANSTTFATAPEALTAFSYERLERPITEVALLTDGIERLALHFQSRSVHPPFFRPLFRPLRAGADGFSAPLSDALAAFLGSPQVNDRTDDDKTLVLATRRAVAAEVAAGEAGDGGHNE